MHLEEESLYAEIAFWFSHVKMIQNVSSHIPVRVIIKLQ